MTSAADEDQPLSSARALQIEPKVAAAPGASPLLAERSLSRGSGLRSEPLAFVEGQRFKEAVGAALCANLVQLAVEIDHQEYGGWPMIDNAILALFTLELALRMAHHGRRFFHGDGRGWAIFDTLLVAAAILSSCLASADAFRNSELAGTLWLSRFGWSLRIFRIYPRLNAFMMALLAMMRQFVWIFSVLFLFCFVSAIVCTQVLGQREFESAKDADQEHIRLVRLHFGSVSASLFSLFQVTTQDNWGNIAMPTVALMPQMRLFFVGFIIFCSWTMISILTAVASDSMLEATTDRKAVERQQQLKKQQQFISFLRECFHDGDADENGMLDKEEFDALVREPEVINEMRALGGALTSEELTTAWKMLDVQDAGVLTIDAFVDGISYLHDSLSTKHVVGLEGKVKRVGYKLKKGLEELELELAEVKKQHEEITRLTGEHKTRRDWERCCLDAWLAWATQHDATGLAAARAARGLDADVFPRPAPPGRSPSDALGESSTTPPKRTSLMGSLFGHH
mmetsp:Transcript_10938/g.31599  ORF Transcript_10938/g.31599 Transcript_10938/m.31599 type:complete len:512 (-) Transcript_10938:99-1634(-)